jgi:hypothetical protein
MIIHVARGRHSSFTESMVRFDDFAACGFAFAANAKPQAAKSTTRSRCVRQRDDWRLRFDDPTTEVWLPTPAEERAARMKAETEVARLRRELDTLKGQRNSH